MSKDPRSKHLASLRRQARIKAAQADLRRTGLLRDGEDYDDETKSRIVAAICKRGQKMALQVQSGAYQAIHGVSTPEAYRRVIAYVRSARLSTAEAVAVLAEVVGADALRDVAAEGEE